VDINIRIQLGDNIYIFNIYIDTTCENNTVKRIGTPKLYEVNDIAKTKAWMATEHHTRLFN